ncbi:hypothetical protein EPUS_07356 [Endocarpon pusillum Z07020]|uniref:Geranylgeranyl transferase type-2 subunit alpha n=1 Tax=Endocarpon pusillum (strain Z07020 / HMAS-L-300199) TaxID=1263415 RepID=U1HN92_ENDPU|nr:uncharacterized protein EPUS_07356 [Endocarpon pusillum Z07020]ERF70499.1 hypothetical protein EPUS_07356 [Endocarpon pusillum Z07020]
MASHGVRRIATREDKSADARAKEAKEIKRYQELVEAVQAQVCLVSFEWFRWKLKHLCKVRDGDLTPELLQKTAEILKTNPEYYTIWNHRRRIYVKEFNSIQHEYSECRLTAEHRDSQILDIIQLDLQFLLPLLMQFPKCYWIWNHRIWLLQQATSLLPAAKARPIWEEELRLAGKMLSRDNRNFHGWGYRRMIINSLESEALNGKSMATNELDYTKKMISTNLSNFSAWHNRTKLILRILDEKCADDDERKQMLDEELALIHKALCDPYDQSLWFYHQNLLCAFDPDQASETLAPHLTSAERLEYIFEELEFIKEMLDDVTDCKWIYQALIECRVLIAKTQHGMSKQDQEEVKAWLIELRKLDKLRNGRWVELGQKLGI